jgi:PAS domain S-box-containing protein
MEDGKKTRKQLIEELKELRQHVAELKGFEEEIEQTRVNQEKFAKAFLQNSIPVGITTLKEGRFVDVSDAYLRLMGRKRDEVVGHTSTGIGFITAEQRESFFEELNKRGRIENFEMKVRTKDGTLRDGLFNAVMMNINNEKYLLTVMTDITYRKSIERTLSEEHQMLSSILDGSPVSSFVIDRNRRVTAWNMVNEFFTGISKEDILGEPLDLSPLFKDRGVSSLADLVLEMSDEEIMKHYGHKGVRKSDIHPQAFESIGSIWIKGKEHIMAIQATRLRDAAGNVIGAIQCAQDISRQKQFEKDLRKSEEKYRDIFENSVEGLYRASPEGRFITANPAAARILGYESSEELIGAITDIGSQIYAYPEDRKKALALLKKDGFFKNFEVRNRKKDGNIVWVRANVHLVRDNQGNILYHEGTSQDITDRKRAEEELMKYREGLEQLVKTRTQELENKTNTLEELNTALKVLLQHREEDKREMEDRFVMNIRGLIIPFVDKMKNTPLDEPQKAYLSIIKTHLKDLMSPMIKKMYQFNFTPTEIQVSSLIKEGKTSKEIAKIMGIATSSIDTHRNNIRKKLGISNRSINLRSNLQSLSQY